MSLSQATSSHSAILVSSDDDEVMSVHDSQYEVIPSTQTTVLDEPAPSSNIAKDPTPPPTPPPRLIPDVFSYMRFGNNVLWVSLAGDVFPVHAFLLARASGEFSNMLSTSLGNGEGDTEAFPLPLDNHGTRSEWYSLLDFLYPNIHDEQPVLRNQAYWVNLLSISHKYDFTAAFCAAMEALEHNKDESMSYTLKLSLGLRFRIWEWVKDATSLVVHIPLSTLTPDDISNLGPDIMNELIQLHTQLATHRAYTGICLSTVFPRDVYGCTSPDKCLAVWKEASYTLTKRLIDPHKPAKDFQILEMIEKRGRPVEVLQKLDRFCYARLVESCRLAFDGKDFEFVDHVIQKLRVSSGLQPKKKSTNDTNNAGEAE
ncbi:hypothetical protein BDV93DRAFT_541926 [Ceratobasidium sp. AG-I]|nr:hypothetical protein BDV93DRAFT_541926 [Ceratobasidium sp. AG-I]